MEHLGQALQFAYIAWAMRQAGLSGRVITDVGKIATLYEEWGMQTAHVPATAKKRWSTRR